MVDHDVVRLDVPVHDAHAVAVVEGPQQLVEVAADVVVSQGLEDMSQSGSGGQSQSVKGLEDSESFSEDMSQSVRT